MVYSALFIVSMFISLCETYRRLEVDKMDHSQVMLEIIKFYTKSLYSALRQTKYSNNLKFYVLLKFEMIFFYFWTPHCHNITFQHLISSLVCSVFFFQTSCNVLHWYN